jgi:MFS family permease
MFILLRSPFRKEAAYFSLLLGAILVGVIGPLLVPDFGNILAEYKISLTQVIALNGWLVLTYGISSFLCVSLSDAMGRRPMYLASNLVISAGIVWGVNGKYPRAIYAILELTKSHSLAKTYRSLLGARIVQGFGMGAYG